MSATNVLVNVPTPVASPRIADLPNWCEEKFYWTLVEVFPRSLVVPGADDDKVEGILDYLAGVLEDAPQDEDAWRKVIEQWAHSWPGQYLVRMDIADEVIAAVKAALAEL